MATLSQSDLKQVSRFLRGLYRARRVQPLIWFVLKELPALVGSNQVSWNRVVPALGEADVIAWPAATEHAKHQAALARHIDEHPLINHFLQTGNPAAFKISDFLSQRRFHNTSLYDELYRPLNYEDQFAMNFSPLGPQWISLVVARDRRSFTEHDRLLLDLVRPHIAQAYRQARWMNRFAERFDAERILPATSRIVFDSSGTILMYPARAQRWLERYCDDLPTAPDRLPTSVETWLMAAQKVRLGDDPTQHAVPLTLPRDGRLLRIRLDVDELDKDRSVLLLEERSDPKSSRRREISPLTERELEVLLHVESGMHNREIAAALGIQLRTVKKHLEHIFDKLDVDNRTAAVARLRQDGFQWR